MTSLNNGNKSCDVDDIILHHRTWQYVEREIQNAPLHIPIVVVVSIGGYCIHVLLCRVTIVICRNIGQLLWKTQSFM